MGNKHLKHLVTCPHCGRVYQTSYAKTCGRTKCAEAQRQFEQELRDRFNAKRNKFRIPGF